MFHDVFTGLASTLENISRFREEKVDKHVKLIVKTICRSSKKEEDVESSEEDTTILKRDPNKEGTSKKKVMSHIKPSFHR